MLEFFIPWAKSLIVQFSYIGIFFISVISTSTLFVPFPAYTIIFFATGLGLDPLFTGLVSGIGSAVGELTGYLVGASGRYVIEKKKIDSVVGKTVAFFTKAFGRCGFWVILLVAFLPLPFDIIGTLAGVGKYDIKKFYVATMIGKIGKCMFIAYAGHFILPSILWFIF